MMKKLILIIILSITLFLSSCSLLDPDKILKEGYDNLILEQTVVARDFELPQSVSTSFFWPINVDWESSSSLITIDDDIAKVNFISNKEKDTDVELLAKIEDGFVLNQSEEDFKSELVGKAVECPADR